MGLKDWLYGVFHPGWFASGVGIGVVLQVIGWATDLGIVAGLSGYLVMGVIVGWASPGNTVLEPGVAAFCIATIGFVLDHFVLSLLGVGIVAGIGYGLVGLAVGVFGGMIGEFLQGVTGSGRRSASS